MPRHHSLQLVVLLFFQARQDEVHAGKQVVNMLLFAERGRRGPVRKNLAAHGIGVLLGVPLLHSPLRCLGLALQRPSWTARGVNIFAAELGLARHMRSRAVRGIDILVPIPVFRPLATSMPRLALGLVLERSLGVALLDVARGGLGAVRVCHAAYRALSGAVGAGWAA